MKLFGGSGLVKTTFLLVCVASLLVIVMASPSSSEVVKEKSDINSHNQVEESSLQPHKRSKRTIGHIFDMFKKMMDGLFGGGKKGGGKNKGRGRRPGAPPGGGGGYGAPQRPRRPSYGRRPQQPIRNTGGGLSGGYAGGAPPANNYGAAQAPSNNYGAAQAPSNNYGAAQAPSNNYGGPAQQQQNIDSYGSPQANPVGSLDSYGSPAADPIGNQDSYGSPAADPIGNQDSYGSPVAAPVGPSVPQSSYGGGGNAPVRNNRPQQSSEFGPSSVFYMIPAPNLATEAPQGGRGNQAGSAGDSYGSPLANPVSGNSAGGNQDSYGSPLANPVGGAGDSYGSPQGDPIRQSAAPDSYGSPVGQPVRQQSAPASGGYNSPQTNSVSLSSSYNVAPASGNSAGSNPFLSNQQSTYGGGAPPLPITNNDLSGNFVPFNNNQDSYGSPSPVTDLNLPDNNQVVIAGRGNSNNIDSYGSPAGVSTAAPAIVEERQPDYDGSIAPVGTSAPVPDEFLDNSQADSFDSYNNNEVERAPEGELSNVQVDDEEGESSPLFEDLRNVAFTSADDQTSTEAILADIQEEEDSEPIEVDLRGDFVDLTNGLDEYSAQEIDLTNYQETTPIPNLEIEEYEYIGDEDVPPEFPEDLAEIVESPGSDNAQDSLADNQESFGQQESSNYDESEYEYYYDYEEDYEIDPEQLPDNYQDTYGGQTTASPLRSSTANFISVPLMIEEVAAKDNTAPVILAGSTSGSAVDTNQLSSYGNRNTKRRAPHAFHQFLVEPPQAKRQADWSQRLDARRNFVWRQFNLD